MSLAPDNYSECDFRVFVGKLDWVSFDEYGPWTNNNFPVSRINGAFNQDDWCWTPHTATMWFKREKDAARFALIFL